MLPIGLVRRGPLRAERRRVLAAVSGVVHLVDVVGVVVLHLVVVPSHDEGERGVRGLQRRVGLVLRVPVTVVAERAQLVEPRLLGGCVLAYGGRLRVALVDVVADVQHDVEVLGGQSGVGREAAVLPVLAVDDPEGER